MAHFLWLGTFLGAVFGVLHAFSVYRNRLADAAADPAKAFYFAAWTIALWTIFGAYLLAFWLIGACGMALTRLLRARQAKT